MQDRSSALGPLMSRFAGVIRTLTMPVDYSAWAKLYSQARPKYPGALFEYLSGLCDQKKLAWDCATGNGQAARGLADHFERVIATDQSPQQLREAIQHPRIEYRVAPAEHSPLADQSIDLVTIATAIHWFDLDAFYQELRRVLRRGGVAAAWAYHVAHAESDLGESLWSFYRDIVGIYFPRRGADLVDNKYVGIRLPGSPIAAPQFWMEAEWDRNEVLAFVRSWSGTQAYIAKHGTDPSAALRQELDRVFVNERTKHSFRWPLYLKVSRL
jgi:SAM-dependent methyltransferase